MWHSLIEVGKNDSFRCLWLLLYVRSVYRGSSMAKTRNAPSSKRMIYENVQDGLMGYRIIGRAGETGRWCTL